MAWALRLRNLQSHAHARAAPLCLWCAGLGYVRYGWELNLAVPRTSLLEEGEVPGCWGLRHIWAAGDPLPLPESATFRKLLGVPAGAYGMHQYLWVGPVSDPT